MAHITSKIVHLDKTPQRLAFRKLSDDEIRQNFRADLVIQEVVDQSEYMTRVVEWCYPELEDAGNLTHRNVINLYAAAVLDNSLMSYENMFSYVREGVNGRLKDLLGVRKSLSNTEFRQENEAEPDDLEEESSGAKSLTDIIAEQDFADVDSKLKQRVIGQEKTIDEILDWMLLLKYDASLDPDAVTNLYLMGPSGVGKTTFAQSLADILDVPLLKVAGSQYAQEHAARDLIGAPKSYIGYDPEGGILSKFIKDNPASIVLFDEADKMHPAIYDNLVNFMDTGWMTTPGGNEYKFDGCVFFTSNLGNRPGSLSQGRPVGFAAEGAETGYDLEKDRVMNIVRSTFPREILGRINDFVLFQPLSRETVNMILDTYIDQTQERFRAAEVEIDPEARKAILDRGYSTATGARELQNAYERAVFQPILRSIEFDPAFADAEKVVVGYDGKDFTYKPLKEDLLEQ